MSVERNYYVIAGYDLTNFIVDEQKFYEEWRWTEEGEKYFCGYKKDNVQLFNDGMRGDNLYLGYVLACADEYDFDTVKFKITDIENVKSKVNSVLLHLQNIGLIADNDDFGNPLRYEIIVFEEDY